MSFAFVLRFINVFVFDLSLVPRIICTEKEPLRNSGLLFAPEIGCLRCIPVRPVSFCHNQYATGQAVRDL